MKFEIVQRVVILLEVLGAVHLDWTGGVICSSPPTTDLHLLCHRLTKNKTYTKVNFALSSISLHGKTGLFEAYFRCYVLHTIDAIFTIIPNSESEY